LDPKITRVGDTRNSWARKGLQEWLNKAGLPYHSPHKFRHGHVVYALKNAKDISALKAVSQNSMHANLSIIDGVYGILLETDVREQIAALGQNILKQHSFDIDLLANLVAKRIQKLEDK
jgi:integrase